MDGIRDLLIFILVLGGLVFFHELGHFLAAKRVGVKVKEFGIGFPPRLVKLGQWQETEFTLNWIPFGGFVRPIGEDDPNISGGLAAAPKRHRVFVLAAGPGMNILVAFLVLSFGFVTGWPDQVMVSIVEPDTPAAEAGLRAGDIVTNANGSSIHIPSELIAITHDNLGDPIALEFLRAGEAQETVVTPRTVWPEGQGPMGIGLSWEIVSYSLPRAMGRAGSEIGFQIREMALLPVRLITKQIDSGEVRLVSPVGLKAINDQAVEAAFVLNALFPVLQIVALVSLALAITNLLPLPALDGGRILFVLVEVIRGRRIAPEREGLVHFVGLAMLLLLMVVLVVQDIVNPIFPAQ